MSIVVMGAAIREHVCHSGDDHMNIWLGILVATIGVFGAGAVPLWILWWGLSDDPRDPHA